MYDTDVSARATVRWLSMVGLTRKVEYVYRRLIDEKPSLPGRHVCIALQLGTMTMETRHNFDDDDCGDTSELVYDVGLRSDDDSCFSDATMATRTAMLTRSGLTVVAREDRVTETDVKTPGEDRVDKPGSSMEEVTDQLPMQSPNHDSGGHLAKPPRRENEQRTGMTAFSVTDILSPTKFQKTVHRPRTGEEDSWEAGTGRCREEIFWHASVGARKIENIFRTGELCIHF